MKCIEIDFVFFCSDDDPIELKAIPLIIELIKNNPNITQIIGKIGDKRPGHKKFTCDKILKPGHESLTQFFYHGYMLEQELNMYRKRLKIKERF